VRPDRRGAGLHPQAFSCRVQLDADRRAPDGRTAGARRRGRPHPGGGRGRAIRRVDRRGRRRRLAQDPGADPRRRHRRHRHPDLDGTALLGVQDGAGATRRRALRDRGRGPTLDEREGGRGGRGGQRGRRTPRHRGVPPGPQR
ncbi:MAG: BRAMP, partial [uncultured Nocardioides sp.]